jgi:hypothetical protein
MAETWLEQFYRENPRKDPKNKWDSLTGTWSHEKGKQTMSPPRNTFYDDEPSFITPKESNQDWTLGNSTGSGFGSYGNAFGDLGGLTKTNSDKYRGLRFQGFDKPMDLPKGSIEPGWLEGLDMSNFTFGGGADDDNTSWGSSGGDDKTDWLGWSQVASGLGQAFANYKQSQAAMAKIPLLRDELNFRKASFKDQQGDRRTLHNNAINQQKGLLESDFYNDPTRAASLRTLPA